MKRLLFALIAGAMVFTVAFASAALLEVRGETIQAGVDTDVTCDATGVDANWGLETDTNLVSNVRITGIDTQCAGADMFVSVNGAHALKVTLDTSGQAKFVFPTPLTPESINDIKVWIEG
jgi:hypothetical protein